MQFEVSDAAAITFAHEFYAALAESLPVDAALGEARKVIFSTGNEIEWGTPVLYLRAADGLIFKFDRSEAAVETSSASEVTPVVKKQKAVAAVSRQPSDCETCRALVKNTWALITTTFGFWAGWAAFVYWFDEQLFYDGVATTLILGTLVGLLMGGGITAGFFIMGFRIKLKYLVGILPTWMGSLAVNLFVLSSSECGDVRRRKYRAGSAGAGSGGVGICAWSSGDRVQLTGGAYGFTMENSLAVERRLAGWFIGWLCSDRFYILDKWRYQPDYRISCRWVDWRFGRCMDGAYIRQERSRSMTLNLTPDELLSTTCASA
jgi:hypothetical protein